MNKYENKRAFQGTNIITGGIGIELPDSIFYFVALENKI